MRRNGSRFGRRMSSPVAVSAPIGPFDTWITTNRPLSRWWRPEDMSAGTVTTWTDFMNSESVTQATGAQKPTRGTGINSHPSVGFVRASSQYLSGAPTIAGLMALVQPCTIFYVVKHGPTAFTGGYAVGFGRTAALSRSYAFGTNNDATGTFGMSRGTTSLGSAPAMNGLVKVVSATYDGTTQKAWVGGSLQVNAANGDASAGQSFDLTVFGARILAGTVQGFVEIELGDVLVVPGAPLSDAVRQAGETYFAAKYA